MKWQILDSEKASAKSHMDKDQALLQAFTQPTLHFYEWERPSATYGYFIKPEQFLDNLNLLDIAKRPTGGGIIFHLADCAFSVLIPANHPAFSINTLDNYAFVNQAVSKAIHELIGGTIPELLPIEPISQDFESSHFCMAKPTKYDVMIGGKKVGGAAQRRSVRGFLHQGTISLGMPSESLMRSILKAGSQVYECMRQNSFYLLGAHPTVNQLRQAQQDLKALLKAQLAIL